MLTVLETFRYQALLRLPTSMSKADKMKRAEQVIMEVTAASMALLGFLLVYHDHLLG
jgi:hypothetical protein